MANDNKNLNRIKVILAEKNLQNKWLAEQLGRDQATVSKWVTNSAQPSLDMLIKISAALGKDVNMFLEERSTPMNHTYSLRLYDDELLTFALEEKGLEGLKSHILSINENMKDIFPLDL